MRKIRFTESRIIGVIKQSESVVPMPDICHDLGIIRATFYK